AICGYRRATGTMENPSDERIGRIRVGSKQGGKSGTRAPETTFEETKYLKKLIENGTSVRVRLSNNEEVRGVVEYYDSSFIRITRAGQPNLFIFKQEIKYLVEEGA